VFALGKSPVEVQPEILDAFLLRKVYAVHVDWRPGFSSCGECDVDRLGFVSFHCKITYVKKDKYILVGGRGGQSLSAISGLSCSL
jgi:hypothetical protein